MGVPVFEAIESFFRQHFPKKEEAREHAPIRKLNITQKSNDLTPVKGAPTYQLPNTHISIAPAHVTALTQGLAQSQKTSNPADKYKLRTTTFQLPVTTFHLPCTQTPVLQSAFVETAVRRHRRPSAINKMSIRALLNPVESDSQNPQELSSSGRVINRSLTSASPQYARVVRQGEIFLTKTPFEALHGPQETTHTITAPRAGRTARRARAIPKSSSFRKDPQHRLHGFNAHIPSRVKRKNSQVEKKQCRRETLFSKCRKFARLVFLFLRKWSSKAIQGIKKIVIDGVRFWCTWPNFMLEEFPNEQDVPRRNTRLSQSQNRLERPGFWRRIGTFLCNSAKRALEIWKEAYGTSGPFLRISGTEIKIRNREEIHHHHKKMNPPRPHNMMIPQGQESLQQNPQYIAGEIAAEEISPAVNDKMAPVRHTQNPVISSENFREESTGVSVGIDTFFSSLFELCLRVVKEIVTKTWLELTNVSINCGNTTIIHHHYH